MSDGERWTREQLIELRASRFTPRAWYRFVGASFERAAAARREQPGAQRQALVVAAAGFVPWAAAAALGAVPLAVAGAVWWTFVVLMLEWHLGMLDGLDRLGPANLLGLARAATVPAVLLLPAGWSAAVFIAAGATDAVDGALARRRGETTRLGFWLDGTTDTLVLSAAAVAALHSDLLPWWAAAAVLVRYGLPWPLVAVSYFLRAEPLRRGVSGRLPGLAVFAGLGVAMLDGPGAVFAVLGAVAGVFTFLRSPRQIPGLLSHVLTWGSGPAGEPMYAGGRDAASLSARGAQRARAAPQSRKQLDRPSGRNPDV